MNNPQTIGIVYNARVAEAEELARALQKQMDSGHSCWIKSAYQLDEVEELSEDTGLIITIGGDGTILRVSRISVPRQIPILGINLGRLGFMTEINVEEALEKVPQYLEGDSWVEERSMLEVRLLRNRLDSFQGSVSGDERYFHAVNDMVLGRGAVARLVRIRAVIDGEYLTTYGADAVIMATATGSTGYNLSVGGPILDPRSTDFILKPVAPHVGLASGLVLPDSSAAVLTVETDHPATLSIDGYIDVPITSGDGVQVGLSSHKARFLRSHPPAYYYATLTKRLGFDQGTEGVRGIEY